MSNWSIDDLCKWDEKIQDVASNFGLDWFPITYEICDYYEMMGHMSYHGMPSHYRHWSYGKTFERTHQLYNLGLEGLPYELIINSNPSIAYLMRENPAYMQILIMAHCVGHSDFFKNNRNFNRTRPDMAVMKFKSARDRISKYIENPSIGIQNVELFLDAVHAIRFQTERHARRRLSNEEKKNNLIKKINSSDYREYSHVNIDKIPIEPDDDLLGFLIEQANHLEEWQRDILEIVRNESQYFIPQIKTKTLNEGWASFWHYKILNELSLQTDLHIPFLKSHNQVVRPHIGAVNPYHLGFHIFSKIEKTFGIEECFFTREVHDDESAIRCLIDREDCELLNLFSYSSKRNNTVTIDEVSDEDGWKKIRNDLIMNTGISPIPLIKVVEIGENNELILEHDHDGRDLDLEYAEKVVHQIRLLWPGEVKLFTVIEEDIWEI